MCLLCPLPTGSPMTPASWGVRRMLFGYFSHSRWLSCARRWFAEYPPPLHLTLYTLHSTPYTPRPTQAFPPSVMCTAVVRRVSSVSVSIRAHLWAVYLPRHLLCFASGLAIFSPLSFRSRGCLVLGDDSPSIPRLYTLHSTPYTLRPTPHALHRRSHHLSCARRWLAVSPVFPCQSVLIRGRYISAICCVLPVVWQCSRLFPFTPIGCHALVIPITSKSLPLRPTLYTLHQK